MKVGERRIGPDEPCYVIAEVGSNHDGHKAKALELIEAAAESGAEAVKFQLFRAGTLYPPENLVVETAGGEVDLYDFFSSRELKEDWLGELTERCRAKGLHFICTPFYEEAVAPLAQAGVDAFKIASPELNHFPLIKLSASTRIPLIISTGISKLGDVEAAVETAEAAGAKDLALLHCVTSYPAPAEDSNLAVMETLRQAFGYPTGLSDHSLGIEVPVTAALAGCQILEKHFTLDKKADGPDHKVAADPRELSRVVAGIRIAEKLSAQEKIKALEEPRARLIMGRARKKVAPSERELYICDSRSIYAGRDINKGESIGPADLVLLRSERFNSPGLHPRYLDLLAGLKVRRDIRALTGIQWDDLMEKAS